MNRRLRHIEHLLDRLITLVERIMPTLDDILADVTQEKTDIASVSTLIKGLKQQIADALSGVTLSPDVQAKVDAIFTGAESNKADIAAAIASGS
jgi:altronate dehydratase